MADKRVSSPIVRASSQGQINKIDTLPAPIDPQIAGEPISGNGNESATVSQLPTPKASGQRTVPQPQKRKLAVVNGEDKPVEKCTFKKASQDALKNRKILTATRRLQNSNSFGTIEIESSLESSGGRESTEIVETPLFNFSTSTNQPLDADAANPIFDFSELWQDTRNTDNDFRSRYHTTEVEATELGDVEKNVSESSMDFAEN